MSASRSSVTGRAPARPRKALQLFGVPARNAHSLQATLQRLVGRFA